MFYEVSGGSSIGGCALVSTEGGCRRIIHNCLSGISNVKGDSNYIKKKIISKTMSFVLINIPCFHVGLCAFQVDLSKKQVKFGVGIQS